MKKILSLMLILLAFMSSFSQNSDVGKYNLPPGFVLNPKRIIFDLSFKIDKTKPYINYSNTDLKVLKNLSSEEIELYKESLGDYYEYYKEGTTYINSLSSSVKNIYTIDEIWYIYIFDQKLKNELLTIK